MCEECEGCEGVRGVIKGIYMCMCMHVVYNTYVTTLNCWLITKGTQ